MYYTISLHRYRGQVDFTPKHILNITKKDAVHAEKFTLCLEIQTFASKILRVVSIC